MKLHYLDCRVGELRLIFRSGPGEPLLAYVHWFSLIPPSTTRNVKLYRIHKQMWAAGQRAGGVVQVSSIVSLSS
jgi:hypothetical protein